MKRKVKQWFRNEKELMLSLGLTPSPGSGNGIIKEDGQNEYIIAQLKSTDGNSISIKLQDINILQYNANLSGKIPIFINQFMDGPILVSCKLEDFSEVAEYIKTGKAEGREIISVKESSETKSKSAIKSGNVKNAAKQIEADREKRNNEYIISMKAKMKERAKLSSR